MHLTIEDVAALEYEILSNEFRGRLCRSFSYQDIPVEALHDFAGRGRAIHGEPPPFWDLDYIYDDDFIREVMQFYRFDIARLIFAFPTAELVEFLVDVGERVIGFPEINRLIKSDGAFLSLRAGGVDIEPLTTLEGDAQTAAAPSIRMLISRMDDALSRQDFSAVVHASASVFEALAKDVIGTITVQNQTLGSIFEGYAKRSGLDEAITNYMLDIYKLRNSMPNAGHGSLSQSTLTRAQAELLTNMTKAFVTTEYRLLSASRIGNQRP